MQFTKADICPTLGTSKTTIQSYSARAEHGVYMVILAGIILAMMIVLGLAVDAANVYRAQQWSSNAADAGTFAGLAKYAEVFGDPHLGRTPKVVAEEQARNVIETILARKGLTIEQFHTAPTFDTGTRQLTVDFEVNVDLLILSLLPGVRDSGFETIRVRSEVELLPAIVTLMLDVSGSMLCLSEDPADPAVGPCDCVPDCTAGDRKLDDLVTAISQFIRRFDPNWDRISVILFSLGAKTYVPFEYNEGFDNVAINDVITALANSELPEGAPTNPSLKDVASGTNHTDALYKAFEGIEDLEANAPVGGIFDPTELDKTYVFFTDGAPTAARFFFDTTKTGYTLAATNDSVGDYYSWAVDWDSAQNVFAPGLQNLVSAPQALVSAPTQTDWDPITHNNAGVPSTAAYTCGTSANDDNPENAFSCIDQTSFNFLKPDQLTPAYPYDLDLPTLYPANLGTERQDQYERFKRQYYLSAIINADSLRAREPNNTNGLIYTIGIGPDPSSTDPFQNVDDDIVRKDVFLRRIANDIRFSGTDPAFPHVPALAIDSPRSWLDAGVHYPVVDGEELKPVFDSIARRVKLRLVR